MHSIMKQTASTEVEKIDPLMRIQEEIKEVVRREQEYRQLTSTVSPASLVEYNEFGDNASSNNVGNDSSNSLTISLLPSTEVTPLTTQDVNSSNAPSLHSSVNSKASHDDQHSDDSGISGSSSPVNDTTANNDELKQLRNLSPKEQRYIGPNCYNMTPEPPRQKLMIRTVSTPHLGIIKPRQFTYSPAHKGVMQRFIASRGKLQLGNKDGASSNKILNVTTGVANATPPSIPIIAGAINMTMIPDFGVHNIPVMIMTPVVIERDADGRPIRPGYVPVELKIQRELKDLKSRESELKKYRKIRQSTPDLMDSIDNENVETDDDDSEVEHCYGPGKLRTAKSISELCDSAQFNSSISPRATPSPDYYSKMHITSRVSGMRPAMSLAQLCDLDPEEAPSSHRLIAQWETLIQQHA